jgi:beta-lactamase regulating signal transducer with metallopeptidase domain
MIMLLSVTIKVAVLTLAALVATAMMRQRSAAVRHFVLATALVCSLGVPVVERVVPSWPVPLSFLSSASPSGSSLRLVSTPAESSAAARPVIASADSSASVLTVMTVMTSIWIIGAVVGCGVLLAGLFRLKALAAHSEPVSSGRWREAVDEVSRLYELRRHVRILLCQHPTMLATWGVLRPTILLPAGAGDWSSDRVNVVVRHELAHVRRGDWVVALTANVLMAMYWFNPLLWIACRRLRHEGERACDDLVLASGISGAEYATHLVAVARQSAMRHHPWSPAIAIAHHSMLERRVRAMLNARVNREPLTVFARATTVAALAAVTLSIGIASVSGETSPAARPDVPLAVPGISPVISAEQERRPVESRAAANMSAAQAQPAGGAIEGVLYDQFGGLLPGASVRLTQIGTGNAHSVLTDRGGAFVFRGLSTGDYELITELPGFIAVKNVVRAEQGETARRHITLPIGTIEETVHATCSNATRVTSPTAPTGSASPGPAQPQARTVQRGVPPKIPGSTFTGGIGGQIRAPRKLAHTNPICPANVAPEQAVVRLAGRIGIDGLLTDLRDVSTDAPAAYVASALEAVRQWVFSPTLLNDAPIETNISVTVSYSWSN